MRIARNRNRPMTRYNKRNLSTNQKIKKRQKLNENNSITILRCPFEGMPDVFRTTVVYFENNFKFDLGTTDKLLFIDMALNDPYDPYISLGGKSANLFQQIMTMYRFCRVNFADVQVKYTDVSQTGVVCPTQLALVLNSEQVNYADMDDIQSLPQQRRRVTNQYNDRIGTTYDLRGTFKPKDCFYMTNAQWSNLIPGGDYDVTNLGGIASPNILSRLSIYYGRIDETNTTALGIRATVQIKYDVTFSSRQSFSE